MIKWLNCYFSQLLPASEGVEGYDKDYSSKFLTKLLFSIIALPVVYWLLPHVLSIGFFDLWKPKGTLVQWLMFALPIFLWGGGLNVITHAVTRNKGEENRNAEDHLIKGAIISITAGVGEEIVFRWIFFLSSIVSVQIANFFIFGFLGFGVSEWVQLHITGPLANLITFGNLGFVLVNPSSWAVGAGLLASNAFFRDGHRYQGPLGLVNSWVIGMFLFVMLFKFGLLACIIAHFLYDFLIFVVGYIDRVIERQLGWVN